VNQLRISYSDLANWLDENAPETLSVFDFSEVHRRWMRVIRIFPNRTSCLRLVSALCQEQAEEWMRGNAIWT